MGDNKIPNKQLKHERERRGWSQEKLAELLGTSFENVSRWERGMTFPQPHFREKLCALFGKDAVELGLIEPLETPESSHTGTSTISSAQTVIPSFSIHPNDVLTIQNTGTLVLIDERGYDNACFPQEEISGPSLQVPLLFDVGIWMLLLAQQQEFWSPSEFMKRVELALESSKGMSQRKLTRRQALELLVSVSIGLLSTTQSANSFAAEEVVSLCATSIPACWSLFWTGEFSEVEKALPTYFSQLTPLAQMPSKYQKSAANLVSQAHQITSLLVLEREDFGTSLAHCKQAFLYGQIAGDPNLQAASLIRQANTLFYRNTLSYLRRHAQILETYQQAMQYIHDVLPLIRGRIYSGLASAQATLGQTQDALRHIGLAQEAFPEHPEDDPGFLYTYTTRYILHFNEALAHLSFGQPKQAEEALAKAATFVPNEVSPRGLELQNHRVIIAIASGNLDQSCAHFQTMVSSGFVLGSDLHQNEAHTTYEHMLTKWPREQRVKELADLFQKKSQS
jgi:transcriptional regulator with XRE-family HTH domain/tetratricopeptide (TPR) repeat protein